MPDPAGRDPARRLARWREDPGGHPQDGPQHGVRRLQGRPRWAPDRPQDADNPVAGRKEGHRVARGAGAGEGALPDAAVESAPMSHAGKVFAVAGLAALGWAVALVAEARPPIRIGATVAQTGAYAALGQNLLRGYQLCVKHMNDK